MNRHQPPDIREIVMREILRYLIEHPGAKDTLTGINKWWLVINEGEWGKAVVQEALDLLVERGWLTVRRMFSLRRIYGLDPTRLEEIRAFLNR